MRASRLLAAWFVGALASCSLITSFDGLGSGGAGGATMSTSVASTTTSTATSGGAMTGGGDGSGGVAGGSTTGSGGSGGSGGGTDAGTGGQDACPPGSFHCGTGPNHATNHNTLYSCNASHQEILVEHCAHGCVVRVGADDMCGCQAGGFYCGGDDLVGDKNTLYTCKTTGGISGTVKQHCPNTCIVAPPGSDDHCN